MGLEGLQNTSSEHVLETCRKFAPGGVRFTGKEIAKLLGVQTPKDREKLRNRFKNLVRSRALTRCERDVFRLTEKGQGLEYSRKQQVMWRYLRIQKTLGVEDLMVLAEVSENYAQEWLNLLVERGIVRDHGNGKFQLIKSVPHKQGNAVKGDNARNIKLALQELQSAREAIQRAESLLGGMDLDGVGNAAEQAD